VKSRLDALEVRERTLDHPDALALISDVQEYYVLIYGGPDTSPIDPRELARPDGAFFIGYLAGEPVVMGGWRFAIEALDVPAQRPAELKRMYVVPAHRGTGLGKTMLRHLEQSALAAGADMLVLETGSPQVDAVGLYLGSGYSEIPRFGHYKDEPAAVHLGKSLSGTAPSAS
jgi:GNAT superfamily N-acetyltransferase